MTLSDWMTQTGTTPQELAARIGVHWVTVYKWRNGTKRPSWAKLDELRRVTDGAVTAADFESTPPEESA